jgi:osomolarity two-component system response regulator SSK1
MSSIKTRLHNARHKFLRRSSATSTATRSLASSAGSEGQPQPPPTSSLRKSASLQKLPEASDPNTAEGEGAGAGDPRLVRSEALAKSAAESPRSTYTHSYSHTNTSSNSTTASASTHAVVPTACPEILLEAPTPIHPPLQAADLVPESSRSSTSPLPASSNATSQSASHALVRRQSVVANTDASILGSLLVPDIPQAALAPQGFSAAMLHRKIWVKRPHASATLVQIREDDLVDDVREMILKKYANSLGRSFDSPDVTLRILPRDTQRGGDRTLGPEEEMCRTLDAYFPGGQTVTEALVIDVPQRRTPKPSPRVPFYYAHHEDGVHQQTEYFPPMPVIAPSPQAMGSSQHEARIPLPHAPHSIAVLNTGQLPALPSPGGTRRGPLHTHRPKYPRTHTASPTTLGGGIPSSATTARPLNRPRHDSSASEAKNSASTNNAIPTPPASTEAAVHPQSLQTSSPPTPRISSPRPNKGKKQRKPPVEAPSLPAGLLDGSVPPINVLIVEDNIINLRVLGAFMQRLKVRWQRAMNGKEAVTKWKAGGFHLVLMDIQLPVMNGLEATKEIRRLERVNSIGVFSSGSSEAPNNRLGQDGKGHDELIEDDRLGDKGMFKSPVIIVALTASSLQSDRHEALAAGCNDFLTKVRSDPLLLLRPVLTSP